jgi:alpha-ketoglutarate-dependent taurine dioxygenase
MSPSVPPFAAALGAEVTGIDLRQPLDAAAIAAIRAAFDQHIVLCIRGQELSEEDQLCAASYFGKVHVRRKPAHGRDPGGQWDTPFMLVTNIIEGGKPIGVFGDGEMWFHHDTSYYAEPHRATLLYAMQLPSCGGNTCFSNMGTRPTRTSRARCATGLKAARFCKCTTTSGASGSTSTRSTLIAFAISRSRSSSLTRQPAARRSM